MFVKENPDRKKKKTIEEVELNTGEKLLLELLLKIRWNITVWKDKLKTELCILGDYSY